MAYLTLFSTVLVHQSDQHAAWAMATGRLNLMCGCPCLQGQRAKELQHPVLTKKATRLCYSEAGAGPDREAFLTCCTQQPELHEHLERSIRLHLAGFPAYKPRESDATLLCNLPDVCGSVVSPPPAAALTESLCGCCCRIICCSARRQLEAVSAWYHIMLCNP